MEWYYAEGRQQRGPVSAEEFQRLVKDGTVRADTLVWREGMSNWQPYGQVVQTSPPELVSEGGLVCSQCGRAFPVGEVTHHGEGWICGSCKPPAMGLSGEGAGALSGEEGAVSVDELLARDYTVDTGDYFSRSLELLRNNAGLLIGATALIYLVMIAVSIIPYLSMILSLIFTGPLMGGLWLLYIRVTRGEVVSVGDAFAGFGPSFVQLLLANAVTGILSGLCLLPAFLVMIVAAVGSEFSQQGGGGAVGEFVGGGCCLCSWS
jgi:hypothetical protein